VIVDTGAIRAFLDDRHVALAERIAEYATRVLAPLPEPADDAAARQQARELLGKLGAAGWFAPIRDQDWRACCIIREALGATSPLADAVFALQALGVVPMLLTENDGVRKRWLDPAIQGRAMASFAMTEPDAGSDVASIGTTAVRNGDAYVLTGTKTFISNAGLADFYTVFATTDPAKRDKGIGCFVYRRTPPDCDSCEHSCFHRRIRLARSPFTLREYPKTAGSMWMARVSNSVLRRWIACARPSAPRPAAWRHARWRTRWRTRRPDASSASRCRTFS